MGREGQATIFCLWFPPTTSSVLCPESFRNFPGFCPAGCGIEVFGRIVHLEVWKKFIWNTSNPQKSIRVEKICQGKDPSSTLNLPFTAVVSTAPSLCLMLSQNYLYSLSLESQWRTVTHSSYAMFYCLPG